MFVIFSDATQRALYWSVDSEWCVNREYAKEYASQVEAEAAIQSMVQARDANAAGAVAMEA